MNHEIYLGTAVIMLLVVSVLYAKNRKLNASAQDLRSENILLKDRYAPVIDVDAEAAVLQKQLMDMKRDYTSKKARYDELVRTVAAYDEEVELAEFGFYKPHFDFDTSEKFKIKIQAIKGEQKEMMRSKQAIVCNTQFSVDNNRAKGQTMINRAIRLTARAFNNECDTAIATVRWDNIQRLELRVKGAFDAINKANESLNTFITPSYLDLKLTELRLSHEYQEKKQQEREDKAEIRRQEREEAQLRKEAAEASDEAARYANLLKQARSEAQSASPERLGALTTEIEELQRQLAEAHAANERALSMAEQTRSGYVYVISNVGSFGDAVYKIGMTRRLDPMDRVRELSAAGVPFVYDAHAMVYTEDAPAMEAALHKAFDNRRVNKVNLRKEFFRVTLPEVKQEVERLFPEADFVETIEAREFRETRSLDERLQGMKSKNDALTRFPGEL